MAMLSIRQELLERLEAVAAQEGLAVAELADLLLARDLAIYDTETQIVESKNGDESDENPSLALVGAISADETQLTDLSTSIREIIENRFREVSDADDWDRENT